MLCSTCSEEIKPIVAVDIDGTLADYHGHFLGFADDYFGWRRHARDYIGDKPFKEWWMETHAATERMWHDVKLAYRQGGMKRTMPAIEGATHLCKMIRHNGAELWVTTTRPYLSLDNIVPDTVEWLRRNGIRYDGMLFDEDKYEQLANRIDSERVVAVLDDLPEMYDAAAQVLHYGWDVPILVKGEYNRGVTRQTMATLTASIFVVLDQIQNWEDKHASDNS